MKVKLAKFDLTGFPDLMNDTSKRFATNERRSFYRTVENWENKPSFYIDKTPVGFGLNDYNVSMVESENSKKWHWIDKGTELHVIEPIGEGYSLRFQTGYSPKTTPRKLTSSGSGERSGGFVKRDQVKQKIEPRNFTEKIKDKAVDRWSNALETELKNYVKKKA